VDQSRRTVVATAAALDARGPEPHNSRQLLHCGARRALLTAISSPRLTVTAQGTSSLSSSRIGARSHPARIVTFAQKREPYPAANGGPVVSANASQTNAVAPQQLGRLTQLRDSPPCARSRSATRVISSTRPPASWSVAVAAAHSPRDHAGSRLTSGPRTRHRWTAARTAPVPQGCSTSADTPLPPAHPQTVSVPDASVVAPAGWAGSLTSSAGGMDAEGEQHQPQDSADGEQAGRRATSPRALRRRQCARARRSGAGRR